jgi:hypothetical protein
LIPLLHQLAYTDRRTPAQVGIHPTAEVRKQTRNRVLWINLDPVTGLFLDRI